MTNYNLYRGGTPEVRFMWSKKDYSKFNPPLTAKHLGAAHKLFGNDEFQDTPPYDSHADGAYNLGNFVIGASINPNGRGMISQRTAFKYQKIAVGDVLQLIWLPEDHVATLLNLKSINWDSKMAGATVALIVQNGTPNADTGEFEYTEDTDFAAAVTAQHGSNVFKVDEAFNAMISLYKVNGDYAVPMYGQPCLPAKDESTSGTAPVYKFFGLKVLSLPTDANVTFADMRKSIYMSLRMEAFECPSA